MTQVMTTQRQKRENRRTRGCNCGCVSCQERGCATPTLAKKFFLKCFPFHSPHARFSFHYLFHLQTAYFYLAYLQTSPSSTSPSFCHLLGSLFVVFSPLKPQILFCSFTFMCFVYFTCISDVIPPLLSILKISQESQPFPTHFLSVSCNASASFLVPGQPGHSPLILIPPFPCLPLTPPSSLHSAFPPPAFPHPFFPLRIIHPTRGRDAYRQVLLLLLLLNRLPPNITSGQGLKKTFYKIIF